MGDLSQSLWELILRISGGAVDRQAQALRVLLFIYLRESKAPSLRLRLTCCRKLWRWLTVPAHKGWHRATRGSPWFAFTCDTAAHVNNLLPVLHAAQMESWQPGILLGDCVLAGRLGLQEAGNRIEISNLMATTTATERLSALAQARRIYIQLRAGFASDAPQWFRAYCRCRFLICAELTLFVLASLALRRFYEAWRPSCVVSTSDFWPFEHAIFAEARRSRIPSLVVQHGLTNIYWWPFVADRVCLWGEPFRQQLIRMGAPEERLTICGMPAADHLFSRYANQAMRPAFEQGLSCVILSGTHTRFQSPRLYHAYGQLLKQVLTGAPRVQWLVKLHPSEDESFYRDAGVREFGNLRVLPKSTTLEAAISQAGVACTLDSAAGLEAMMMQRPVVVFDVQPSIRSTIWWPQSGGGLYASTSEAVLHFIRRATGDEPYLASIVAQQNEFLSRNFAQRGCAAATVVHTIQEILSQSGRGANADGVIAA